MKDGKDAAYSASYDLAVSFSASTSYIYTLSYDHLHFECDLGAFIN